MALGTFIAGRYSTTYNAVDVGITDGYEFQQESRAEPIEGTDVYGDSIIDLIYRGGNAYLQFESKEYKAGSTTPFWPWSSLGLMGLIGRLGSNVASATVMTSTASTPAAATPATQTSSKSILAPNSPARLLYHSKLRQVPVRLLLLPYDTGGGVIGWATST